jgi:hypothetical protein
MGVVIDFPADHVAFRARGMPSTGQDCEVVILPVIRIDRYEDQPVLRPTRGGMPGGKRRRRVSRS